MYLWQKTQAILAQQKGKAEKAEEHEKQAALLSKQLLLEKSNLETLTAELRREQQKLQQKQTFVQQLKKEKDEAQRKARRSAFVYSEGVPFRSLNDISMHKGLLYPA